MTRKRWGVDDIPDQSGRTLIVTGANSGLGLETTRALAGKGATVIMACRNLDKAARAESDVRASHPGASLEVRELDLADLSSVRSFTQAVLDEHERLDGLINNAGVMAIPRRETADGFEMQLGTNHFGHFALTGLLLPRLLASDAERVRVVTVSSTAHRMGRMHFDDLQLAHGYGDWKAYGQSKLANLLFAFELDRRLRAGEHPVASLAAHPGYADTDLQAVGPRVRGNKLMAGIMKVANAVVAQPADMGALPTLRAATDPSAVGGQYYGPGGLMETRGYPEVVQANDQANSQADAERLWGISEELTGVTFDL